MIYASDESGAYRHENKSIERGTVRNKLKVPSGQIGSE
jgi:hypothetical protein